jgi:hypothetical protein
VELYKNSRAVQSENIHCPIAATLLIPQTLVNFWKMGETLSCVTDEDETTQSPQQQTSSSSRGRGEGGGGNDDIIDFTEDTKEILNLFDLASCLSDASDPTNGYDIDRDEFIELSQDDLPVGVSARDIDERLATLGNKVKCFYQVPLDLDKPVGLRRYPHKNSPRTGDVIQPGEVIQVIQEIDIDGVKYVRTIGGSTCSGWMFQTHPLLGIVMLEYLPGELVEKYQSYMFKTDQSAPITILTGPSENCGKTSHSIFPGEEIDISEIWKPCDGEGKTFVKLCDGRGWVELNHPVTNIEMFCEIVP